MREDAYMTAQETAQYLHSSCSTLAKLRMKGKGPVFVRIGRAVRYRPSDVDAWLRESASRRSAPVVRETR